jgi:hypothetical protein
MKVIGNCLKFPEKKKDEVIWTSRTWDMGWILNSVWAAEQIRTSLLLQFGIKNGLLESCITHESFRPMS